jgi:O-acetylhomoserine/O-acetylserine sulfhydrylase-like pyridoxal-dependent enzyme
MASEWFECTPLFEDSMGTEKSKQLGTKGTLFAPSKGSTEAVMNSNVAACEGGAGAEKKGGGMATSIKTSLSQ